jgi:hypothetical protein
VTVAAVGVLGPEESDAEIANPATPKASATTTASATARERRLFRGPRRGASLAVNGMPEGGIDASMPTVLRSDL